MYLYLNDRSQDHVNSLFYIHYRSIDIDQDHNDHSSFRLATFIMIVTTHFQVVGRLTLIINQDHDDHTPLGQEHLCRVTRDTLIQ